MAEYIEREQVMQAIDNIRNIYSEAKNFVAVSAVDNVIGEIVDEVQAADVAPVVHGQWARIDDPEFVCGDFECSKCFHREYKVDTDDLMPGINCLFYCPNCGAKMDEEDKV
ncbi:MAG: hypothetical protein J6A19_04985 [Oscillospiraceae bacterium]|nr:hypothetical protein [Oscillospiraceae bacterium]